MMSDTSLTRDEVIRCSRYLPSFPKLITEILTTLDDHESNLRVLVRCVTLEPMISARILAFANTAAMRGRMGSDVCNVNTAISLIGVNRVRHIVLMSCMDAFMSSAAQASVPVSFWQHSVAVGVSSVELAMYVTMPVITSAALVAGLLHDIGQLWLYRFRAEDMRICQHQAVEHKRGADDVERDYHGVDHCTIGAWLAENWGLPRDVVAAIAGHHQPEESSDITLVSLVHVAEVLSNALDLGNCPENRVTTLCRSACDKLGLVWNDEIRPLFGRIEARSRHTNQFFMIGNH